MPDDTIEMGPISYLIVEFPGNRMTGEGLDVLVDLVDRGMVRVWICCSSPETRTDRRG